MILILSSRYSDDARLLSEAAVLRGWRVLKLRPSDVPEKLEDTCCVYAEGFFAEHVAEVLKFRLPRPAEDVLIRLKPEFLQRTVNFFRADSFDRPKQTGFIKPADQKYFGAGVYQPDELIPGLELLLPNDPILVSDVVNFTREYRFFVLNQTIHTGSIYLLNNEVPRVPVGYEGNHDSYWQTARAFAQRVCDDTSDLPASFVIDVGLLDTNVWAVIEFNPTWASGIYGCIPDKVLDCLEASVSD